MSIRGDIVKSESIMENMREQMKAFFEPQLRNLNLGVEQIKKQNLDQLEQSLVRVNDAINHPESFGAFGIKFDATAGAIIAQVKSQSTVELGILPILLERKKIILERINLLKGKKKIENLQDLVKDVKDPEVKKKLLNEINALKAESEKGRVQSEELAKIQQQQDLEVDKELRELARKTEMFERRSKVWLSFLERESIASLIGGILLLVISCSLILAMFVNPLMPAVLKLFNPALQGSNSIIKSDILNNAFLVLLGYFFGQFANKGSGGSAKPE